MRGEWCVVASGAMRRLCSHRRPPQTTHHAVPAGRPRMSSHSATTRREFLETTTGLVIAFALPWRADAAPGPAAAPPPFAPNAWLRIGTDGIVTLTLDRSEMGQGAQTGLAMILADELDADWSTIRLGPMPGNPAGWSRTMRTGGSNAIRSSWEPLRKAGATAPAMLVTGAGRTGAGER